MFVSAFGIIRCVSIENIFIEFVISETVYLETFKITMLK